MAYAPTTWINGDSITSSLMLNAETQYDEFAPAWGRWYGLQSCDTNTTSVATGITSFAGLQLYGSESPGSYIASAYYDPLYWAAANRTRLVAKKAGYYWVGGKAQHQSTFSWNVVARLNLNGSTELCKQETGIPAQDGSITTAFPIGISDIYDFAADDYVELQVAHNKGTTVSFGGGGPSNEMSLLAFWILRV